MVKNVKKTDKSAIILIKQPPKYEKLPRQLTGRMRERIMAKRERILKGRGG